MTAHSFSVDRSIQAPASSRSPSRAAAPAAPPPLVARRPPAAGRPPAARRPMAAAAPPLACAALRRAPRVRFLSDMHCPRFRLWPDVAEGGRCVRGRSPSARVSAPATPSLGCTPSRARRAPAAPRAHGSRPPRARAAPSPARLISNIHCPFHFREVWSRGDSFEGRRLDVPAAAL